MRSVAAWFVTAALALAATPPARATRDSIVLLESLAERLGGRRVECPARLVAGLDTREATCIATALDAKQFRKQVRGPLRGGAVVPLQEHDWSNPAGTFVEKRVFAGRELFVLRFDESTGIASMVPSHTCLPPEILDGVASAADAAVIPPVLVDKATPEYPERAQAARQAGFAMVQVVVLEDGSVATACPLYVAPAGLGFRAEARKTVGRHRFEAATRNGEPVAYRLNVSVTWEP